MLTVINIRRVFDENTSRQVTVFENGRETLGETGAPLFAQALQPLVLDNRTAEIKELLQQALTQDTKDAAGGKDYGLKLAFVLDLNQKLMAHCFEGAKLACVEGVLPREGSSRSSTGRAPRRGRRRWRSGSRQLQAAGPPGPVHADGRGRELPRVRAADLHDGPPTAAGVIAATPPDARRGYVVLGYDLSNT